MKLTTYWVDTGFACGCVEVQGNKIVNTCPIWKKWEGQSWSRFKSYYKAKVELL